MVKRKNKANKEIETNFDNYQKMCCLSQIFLQIYHLINALFAKLMNVLPNMLTRVQGFNLKRETEIVKNDNNVDYMKDMVDEFRAV